MADPGEGPGGGGGGGGVPLFSDQTEARREVLYTVKKERGRKYSNDQPIHRKRGKYRRAF